MTQKEVKKRRWLKSLGRKKIERIYINKVKHHHHNTHTHNELISYSWWERFWSLWSRKHFGGEVAN